MLNIDIKKFNLHFTRKLHVIFFLQFVYFQRQAEADTKKHKMKKKMHIQFYTDKRHLIYKNKHQGQFEMATTFYMYNS